VSKFVQRCVAMPFNLISVTTRLCFITHLRCVLHLYTVLSGWVIDSLSPTPSPSLPPHPHRPSAVLIMVGYEILYRIVWNVM
jgi:hypothetical protein